MIWKNKKLDGKERKIILGRVILQDDKSFDTKAFRKDFKDNYHKSINKPSGDSSSFAFKVDDELIVLGHMPIQIPHADIEGTAKYAYNWETALEDSKNHKSHLIVSITSGGQDQITRFKIFTQVICSLLRITNSVGVYEGNQSLLIPKNDYINEASLMTNNCLPIIFGFILVIELQTKAIAAIYMDLKSSTKTKWRLLTQQKA